MLKLGSGVENIEARSSTAVWNSKGMTPLEILPPRVSISGGDKSALTL